MEGFKVVERVGLVRVKREDNDIGGYDGCIGGIGGIMVVAGTFFFSGLKAGLSSSESLETSPFIRT